ncbi:hypothetical protein DHEL01_v208481 [Diaporthe helianthi]|uniref:Uncharacterized protein n=1 Tax=Diaporthe helianthi TaxID=158607 RepID=A0A2P5HS84_DIAHE|nr:hypothetical protein DHEL01_v208481 [Diaporthe helianthi]
MELWGIRYPLAALRIGLESISMAEDGPPPAWLAAIMPGGSGFSRAVRPMVRSADDLDPAARDTFALHNSFGGSRGVQ